MSFRTNNSQQLSFEDSFGNLTSREQLAVERSWAKIFSDEVFPAIDEELFRVLYSDLEASRPNTPINVCVGGLIIKELFGYTDDEMVENLMLDRRLQYALHTTSFLEQPLSDKTLSRFRKRCYDYEQKTGRDLIHECITALSEKIAKLMNINCRMKRMDSMMIESNIRVLTRLELLYTCVAKLSKYLTKHGKGNRLSERLKPYTDANDFNRIFYHQRDVSQDTKIQTILEDIDELLKICGDDFINAEVYQIFVRCVDEQTVVEDGKRRLRTAKEKAMNSSILQNPSDPDATFRKKAGKEHRGYVANLEESVGKNASVVTDYRYEQNIYSDSQFFKDRLEQVEVSDEPVTMVTDGGYDGDENVELAKAKNIELITTTLSSGVENVKAPTADFEFSADGTEIEKCAKGYTPRACHYNESSGQIRASFDIEQCANCEHREACHAKIQRQSAIVTTSLNGAKRAKRLREMKTEKFNALAKFRNGVETIVSNLRRNFHLETLPRGMLRGRFFFGFKVAALNFRKLFAFRKGLGHYALNPLFA